MQELGPVIENILQLLWQFHCMPLPERIPRSSLVALDHPVILFEATNSGTCIPIPRIFCDSQQVNPTLDMNKLLSLTY